MGWGGQLNELIPAADSASVRGSCALCAPRLHNPTDKTRHARVDLRSRIGGNKRISLEKNHSDVLIPARTDGHGCARTHRRCPEAESGFTLRIEGEPPPPPILSLSLPPTTTDTHLSP